MNAAGHYTAEVGGDAFAARGLSIMPNLHFARGAPLGLNCPGVGATPGPRAWYSRFAVPC